ncbi:MAG: hypothetical protein U5L09_06360 [Bacteroidales bacterium]|nr:hypothetical protein [Bacteroidales bacterium]
MHYSHGYWATARYGFKASVQITASHNPKEYNGLKVSRENALPVGYDSGLKSLLQMAQNNDVAVADKKEAVSRSHFRYLILILKQYQKNTSGLRVVADCSNGMAGIIIKQIAGNAVSYLNFTPDGSFPNHEPNPLVETNAETLKQAVINSGADVGALFDGDADRVTFIDEKGRFVSPDLIIAVLGHHFLKGGQKTTPVLQDIRTSKAVGEYLAPMGARMHTWRVGRAYAALKLREIDGSFGGELAGHYYFKDFYYSDSGILAFTLVTNILADFKAKGISFSQLLDSISPYANSGERSNLRLMKNMKPWKL